MAVSEKEKKGKGIGEYYFFFACFSSSLLLVMLAINPITRTPITNSRARQVKPNMSVNESGGAVGVKGVGVGVGGIAVGVAV